METSHVFEFLMNHRLSTPVIAETLETRKFTSFKIARVCNTIQSTSFISGDPRDHKYVSCKVRKHSNRLISGDPRDHELGARVQQRSNMN